MEVYQALSLMIGFGMLIIAILAFHKDKKKSPLSLAT
ncbi:putative holin-like toxin [Cytobacillus sp. S13-E01]|nr:putative holin-like toxin [Cytobacillus sp. S13-E01]MDF0725582.1 putative holin-like toxin [Cytobacillus sp. S13-E01]